VESHLLPEAPIYVPYPAPPPTPPELKRTRDNLRDRWLAGRRMLASVRKKYVNALVKNDPESRQIADQLLRFREMDRQAEDAAANWNKNQPAYRIFIDENGRRLRPLQADASPLSAVEEKDPRTGREEKIPSPDSVHSGVSDTPGPVRRIRMPHTTPSDVSPDGFGSSDVSPDGFGSSTPPSRSGIRDTPPDPPGIGDALREAEPDGLLANMDDVIDRLSSHVADDALRAARAVAGIPQNPPATSSSAAPNSGRSVVYGYGGSSFVGNDDINSQAAGNYQPYRSDGPKGPPAARPGGDIITNPAKATRNNTTDSLRPYFRIGDPNLAIPPVLSQIANQVLHTEFGTVAPGSGLGVTNKLFLMNQLREKFIHFAGPLSLPRSYNGPSGLVVPEPLEWQNVITKHDRNKMIERDIAKELTGVLLEARSGVGSLNITGDDFGQLSSISSRGLKRDAESPLEPIIRLPPTKMQKVQLGDGFALSHRKNRRLFDGLRYPDRFEPNVAQSGGPTASRRVSLAMYPFPIGSH